MATTNSRDGTTIGFESSGSGPALVMVDGALGYRSQFEPPDLVALLSRHFTVIRYDRRGRGESGDSQPYDVAREVDDLAAVIAASGDRAFLYGASSGGALVLEATLAGVPTDGIAVYEVPFALHKAEREAFALSRKALRRDLADGRRGHAVAQFLTTAGMTEDAIDELRRQPVWPVLEAIAPTIEYDWAIISDATLSDTRVAGIKVPALVLDGGASPPMLREPAAYLARKIPGAKHETLADQTHTVAAEALAPVLIRFFGGLAAGGTTR